VDELVGLVVVVLDVAVSLTIVVSVEYKIKKRGLLVFIFGKKCRVCEEAGKFFVIFVKLS
jgi:hypothetical protein